MAHRIDEVTTGHCVEAMDGIPEGTVDLVFADPPYNLQLGDGALERPGGTTVEGVDDEWDSFHSLACYDVFTEDWLTSARRAMRPGGTIFVCGTYHNIHRIGSIMQDLGFWLLNDIAWVKPNPMPNFRGTRFTNAHETILWAVRAKGERYTFNYASLKAGNDDLQVRSDWVFPVCGGSERLRDAAGRKVHPTQKPLGLVERALLAASLRDDLVLDPFLGSGTTAAAARRLGRRWIGIEEKGSYARAAQARVDATEPLDPAHVSGAPAKRLAVRVPFAAVVGRGLAKPGSALTCREGKASAVVLADGMLSMDGEVGSIHKMGAMALGAANCNGWTYWHHETGGVRRPIDSLRRMMAG